MYFEAILPVTDYEISSYKHIMEKDRVVVEKKLELLPKKIDIKKPIKVTKIAPKTKNMLRQFSLKYSNPFFVGLTTLQKEQLNNLSKEKNLKHLVLHTYSNDNEIAIKRLETIFNLLPPKLRVNTIYKQDLCYEGNPCDTTNIKLIY